MQSSGFEKLAKKSIKKILATLPRTRSGSGWYIANNKLDEIAGAIVTKCLGFKDIREQLDARKRQLVDLLIVADRRSLSKQDVVDALLDALE